MESKALIADGNHPNLANWTLARQDREVTVWQVALLSMGFDPSKKSEGVVRGDEVLTASYLDRCQFLGKRLREEPCEGYVHWLRNHAYNRKTKLTKNAMVDVVSCIDVLTASKRFDLPPEFVGLREPLAQIVFYVPGRQMPDLIIMNSERKSTEVAQTKEARDTSKSVEKRQSDQRALQLFAIAVDAYGLKPNASATDLVEIVERVVENIKANGFIGNGLGPDAFKKSFKDGLKQALTRGLKLAE